MAKQGLYANIHAKRERIKAGSGEKMRKPGSKGAPTKKAFVKSAKTAKEVIIMAQRGMGAATKGGGAALKGAKNKMMKETSKTTGPAMFAKGGMATKGYAAGGMATKGYAA